MSDSIGIAKQRGFWLRYFLGARTRSTTKLNPMLCSLLLTFTATLLWFPVTAMGQLICTGDACTCDKEKKPPANLDVPKAVHVAGILVEATSQLPFVFDDTVIELRTVESKTILAHVKVDKNGHFDLGVVQAGKYRLIAAREKQDGKLERMPLADQPKPMSCLGDSNCVIVASQHLHGTDLPFEFCPPQ